jgi:hypothetical protein
MDRASAAQFDAALPAGLSPAAANFCARRHFGPEFLPPKVHPVQQFISTRLGSKNSRGRRRYRCRGSPAGGLFLYQEVQLLLEIPVGPHLDTGQGRPGGPKPDQRLPRLV